MAPGSTLRFGPFALDGTDDGLWCGPERCKLTAKAEAVLRSLVARPGRLVRKADLLATVWPDAHVSDWVLTTCIREIRSVLGDVARAPRYIATVHRQGYRFIAPVTVVATPPPLSVPTVPSQPSHAAPPACEALQSAPTAAALEEEHKLVTILCGALAEAPALAARLGPEQWYRLFQTVVGLTQEVLQHYAGTLTLATSDGFTAVFGAPVAQEDHARRAVLAALELRQRLQDHLAAALRGQGQVVGLVGEPGMGKTRLLTEFCRRVPGDQVTVLVGQCLSYGQGTPYLPVCDLVRQICGLVEGDEPARHTAAVRLRLHESGMTAEDDVALLLQLLDLPVAPECLARLSPEARQARTFALLRHLVLDAAQRQPIVLVMENLHWSDPTSETWLASLVERLPGAAVLLLGTYRPGYQPAWGAHAAVTQIAVPPLRAPDSLTVVQAVLGAVSLPEAQLRAMMAQAGGNPFFLEELAWHAVEQGGRDTPGAVPETVHAVLAARLDQLPSEEKQLLQTAAVVGPEVPVPLLQAITELPEAMLHRCLAHLQAAEFLYETRLFPAQVYTFKHALTHEVAYSSLLQARRRALHARLVEVLEARSPDQLAERVDYLAHHAVRGEVWDKALRYCGQAGAKARAASAYREVGGYWEQVREALAHLPPDRSTLEQAIDLSIDLTAALIPLGQWEQRLRYLRIAEAMAEGLADQRRLGRLYKVLATTLRNLHHYQPALAYCQRAYAMVTALGEVDLRIWVNDEMGQIYIHLGAYRQAMPYLQENLTALHGERRYQYFGMLVLPALQARVHLVRCLSELGAFADGVAYGAEALQLAEAVNRPYDCLSVAFRLGPLHVRQGTLHQAIPMLEQAVTLSQEADLPLFYHLCAPYLALAYALAGRATDALAVLGQAGECTYQSSLHLACEEAYLRAGVVAEADRLTQCGLAHARERNERGAEARALWLLGEIAMRCDPPDVAQAETYYQQALALAEKLGMRPLQAHCYLGLGTLYVTADRREPASAALAAAIALYRAMEMTFWLPQAEAALAQVI